MREHDFRVPDSVLFWQHHSTGLVTNDVLDYNWCPAVVTVLFQILSHCICTPTMEAARIDTVNSMEPVRNGRHREPGWLAHATGLALSLFQHLSVRWALGLSGQYQVGLEMMFSRRLVAVFRPYNETRETWQRTSRGGSYCRLENNLWVKEMLE